MPRFVFRALDGGPDIVLDRKIVLIGRDSCCDCRLESIRVSRRHAAASPTESGVHVRDLGTTNGTSLNGTKVASADCVPGDEVTFGSLRFRLEVAGEPDAAVVTEVVIDPNRGERSDS